MEQKLKYAAMTGVIALFVLALIVLVTVFLVTNVAADTTTCEDPAKVARDSWNYWIGLPGATCDSAFVDCIIACEGATSYCHWDWGEALICSTQCFAEWTECING